MPRIISRTITTAGVNLLRDGPGTAPIVEWSQARYDNETAYKTLIDDSGVDIAKLVEGAKIVAPVTTEIAVLDYNGDPLVWSPVKLSPMSVAYTATTCRAGGNELRRPHRREWWKFASRGGNLLPFRPHSQCLTHSSNLSTRRPCL